MAQIEYIAQPISRRQIREITRNVRRLSRSGSEMRFDIVGFVELDLPRIDPDFTFAISPRQQLGQDHALTRVSENVIEVREDIYEGACGGIGRDRLTLAHELGHLFLHSEIRLARRFGGQSIPAYRDPEWQAKAFSGELMMPLNKFLLLDDPEDAPAVFGVSCAAAETQIRAWKKEGVIQNCSP